MIDANHHPQLYAQVRVIPAGLDANVCRPFHLTLMAVAIERLRCETRQFLHLVCEIEDATCAEEIGNLFQGRINSKPAVSCSALWLQLRMGQVVVGAISRESA